MVATAQQELTGDLECNDTNTDEISQVSVQSASAIAKNIVQLQLRFLLYSSDRFGVETHCLEWELFSLTDLATKIALFPRFISVTVDLN